MWLTQASTLRKEGRSGCAVQPDITGGLPSYIAFVGQVAQFNLTSEEETLFFGGYIANIGYPLALRPCREKARLFLHPVWLTRASTLRKEESQIELRNLTSKTYFFDGNIANIRDLGHDYPLALTPCREKASLFLLTMWLTRASTLRKEEETLFFGGYIANIGYPLALRPCREKAPVPA